MWDIARTVAFWIVMAGLALAVIFIIGCFVIESGARREKRLDDEAMKEFERLYGKPRE